MAACPECDHYKCEHIRSEKAYYYGPHLDVYELFHSERLRHERQTAAATKIQRTWRATAAAKLLAALKSMVASELGMTWSEFVSRYINMMMKIQETYQVDNPMIHFNLGDVEKFLTKNAKLLKIFRSLAIDGKLRNDKLREFFDQADMHPTKREVDAAFDAAFKGCQGKGELVFVIDTSAQNDQQTYVAFQNVIKEILKRISHCILPQSVRLGFIYKTETDDQQFGLMGFQRSDDAIAAVDHMVHKPGYGHLGTSLTAMNSMLSRDGRNDVIKMAVVIGGASPAGPARQKTGGKLTAEAGTKSHGAARRLSVAAPNVSRRRKSHAGPPVTSSSSSSAAAAESGEPDMNLAAGAKSHGAARRLSVAVPSNSRRRKSHAGPTVASSLSTTDESWTNQGNVHIMCIANGNASKPMTDIASRPDLVLSLHDRKTVLKIKHEITSLVCKKDCPYCRYHSLAPPGESDASQQPQQGQGGLYEDEVLQLVWTLSPPDGIDVDPMSKSTWMRPVVGQRQLHGAQLLPDGIFRSFRANQLKSCGAALMNSTEYLKCLKVVLEARIQRDGHVVMPAGPSAVETVTDIRRALELTRLYLVPENTEPRGTSAKQP